jgi:nitrate reductase gamma subunit
MSGLLRILENEVQLAALVFMAVVYALRLVWLFQFKSRKERSWATGNERAGIGYSLMNIAMPWAMESVRTKPFFYVQFILFHLGVVAAIAATFIIPYAPGMFESAAVVWVFRVIIGAAFLVALLRLIRRLKDPAVRLISSIDDYASLVLMIMFFAAGFLAVSNNYQRSEVPLIIFFGLTALFLVYVPFSKIGHYLYYPFTHFYLGRTQGHRGVYPLKRHHRTSKPQPAARERD